MYLLFLNWRDLDIWRVRIWDHYKERKNKKLEENSKWKCRM